MLRVLGDGSAEHPRRATATPYERLRLLRSETDRLGFQTTVHIEKIFRTWEVYRQSRPPHALVPVLEHLLGTSHAPGVLGALASVDFRITAPSAEPQDDIAANVQDLEQARGGSSLTTAAVQAARSYLADTAPSIALQHVTGRVTFTPPHLLHEGSSADLALAALIYAGILAYTNQRVAYTLHPAVAFTGEIRPSGAILPVDGSTLPVKVRTVFFSPAEVLVVPRGQLDAARDAVEALRERFPDRPLEVVGVDRLRDVFSDLRIIRRVERSRPVHAARWLWRRRGLVAAAAILTALVLAVALLMTPPLDAVPASATYEGEMLLVRNRYHVVIDEAQVGAGTVAYMSGKITGSGDHLLHAFVDVNGDQRQDLVYALWPGPNTATTSHVRARPIGSKTPFWDVPVADTVRFPESPDAADGNYSISSIFAGLPDSTGIPSLYLTANNLFFPSMLRRIDLRTGETRSTYVHVGHIVSSLFASDLDDDGVPEILCCGINNAFRKAFLAVFDARLIDGHSPAQGIYLPEGLRPGTEKYYLLLPETILGETYHFKRKSTAALRMEFRSDERTFFVHLDDLPGVIDENGRSLSAGFYVYFDRFLRSMSVSTGEGYDILAAQLAAEQKIRAVPDKHYFEQYQRGIQYWDGDRWVNQPVMNRHYLEAARRAGLRAGGGGTPSRTSR
jgi:hypothetical protein